MTGFARAAGRADSVGWTWEVKSLNGRSLDIRARLPSGLDFLDVVLRTQAQKAFTRGNLSVALTLDRPRAAPRVRVNRELLNQLVALARELDGPGSPPRAESLLGLPGVLEQAEEEESEDSRAQREAALVATLAQAYAALAEARREEGARLAVVILGQLDQLASLCDRAAAAAAAQVTSLKQRVRDQVAVLLDTRAELPADRLAQEAALIAAKADVREELDRLAGHVEAARALLAAGGAIGRRLDFLAQEFNREANTLCAKAADRDLSRIGLELKVVIDQLREQAQNIE